MWGRPTSAVRGAVPSLCWIAARRPWSSGWGPGWWPARSGASRAGSSRTATTTTSTASRPSARPFRTCPPYWRTPAWRRSCNVPTHSCPASRRGRWRCRGALPTERPGAGGSSPSRRGPSPGRRSTTGRSWPAGAARVCSLSGTRAPRPGWTTTAPTTATSCARTEAMAGAWRSCASTTPRCSSTAMWRPASGSQRRNRRCSKPTWPNVAHALPPSCPGPTRTSLWIRIGRGRSRTSRVPARVEPSRSRSAGTTTPPRRRDSRCGCSPPPGWGSGPSGATPVLPGRRAGAAAFTVGVSAGAAPGRHVLQVGGRVGDPDLGLVTEALVDVSP